jgi:fatty-acyl-CoA synthase
MTTVAELIRAQADNQNPGLLFEDQSWTYAQFVQACAQRAAFLLDQPRAEPFHVGLLLDNEPEYLMWLGACALAGATLVGINPTRRGDDLARDIRHTECQFVISNDNYWEELQSLDLGDARCFNTDSQSYSEALSRFEGAGLPDVEVSPKDIFCLIFTSGTTGAPKACICSHGRITAFVQLVIDDQSLTPEDTTYVSMPLFHSNALMTGVLPSWAGAVPIALRRKFSASGFLPDIRRFGATYFCYVGKPLAYILATPEQPDDADNPLRIGLGNEAAHYDLKEFERRFGCTLRDSYGSTEGGVAMVRDRDTPEGSLGLAMAPGMQVMNAQTMTECPRAQFDEHRRLLNSDEAIGELVNIDGVPAFEGYWKNEEANAKRTRGGVIWMGDRGYRDADGYFYFVGRDSDGMRVDGENIGSAQVEQVVARHPDVVIAAVYAVPDPALGDRVMAALQLREGAEFDAHAFADFLSAQEDFGSKWMPSFFRIADTLPLTQTSKVIKRLLRQEKWRCDDPIWWQPHKSAPWALLTAEDIEAWEKQFIDRGRGEVLELT